MYKDNVKRVPDQVSLRSTRPAMTNAAGRSMVEMLGVLAIIGVLSAGALAGYSKAMFSYKMNKTIEQATNILSRFSEINEKDWGATESETVSICSDCGTVVKYGIIDKCDLEGGKCRLPLGKVYIDLREEKGSRAEIGGHWGNFDFIFNSSKECIAFALVHWEQALSNDWWSPNGNVRIGNTVIYSPIRAYNGEGEIIKTFPTASDITEACEKACDGENKTTCVITLQYRGYV